MKLSLETKRFLLREIGPEDEQGLFELDSDPEVHRYLGNNPVKSIETVRENIQLIKQQYRDNGIGRWAVIDKETGEFLGWSGLKLVRERVNNHIDFYDVGYRLLRRHWGRGIATETALASIDYAFTTLGASEIYGMAGCENVASNHVLRKVGLEFIEVFEFVGIRHNWYQLSSKTWRTSSNQPPQ